MIATIFWLSVATVVYTYAIYPLVVLTLAKLWPRPVHKRDITPHVSLIVACHNEVETIRTKLENIAQLDYPLDRLQVIVASDGSTDGTSKLVESWIAGRPPAAMAAELVDLPRVGKAAALNAAFGRARGEILVFTDSNSMFDPDAVRNLIRPFADEQVGGVAGNQLYRKSTASKSGDSGERTYWSYDRFLKSCESRVGSVVSATGAIYAIRRELFCPVPAGVTDDFVVSTRVVEQGRRLVFEPHAMAFEPVAASTRAEYARKVRLMTRGQRSLWVMRHLLNPLRYGFYALELWSHKLLRRLLFLPLAAALLASVVLWGTAYVYATAAALQFVFYAIAIVGLITQRIAGKAPKWMTVPAYFVMANAAACVATFNLLRGYQIDMWQPQRHAILS